MRHSYIPEHLLKLIDVLKKLPGVGAKSAERFAFHMLGWQQKHLEEFAAVVGAIPGKIAPCSTCFCLKEADVECPFCAIQKRDSQAICVVAYPKDVFSIEAMGHFKGLYHCLGGLLSPIEGRHPKALTIEHLKARLLANPVQEMILAFDSTLEGDATALFLKREFQDSPLKIVRLAFGMPMGSSLEYVDGGTLARAFDGRSSF
ncbi:MAG: recombination protein RecR [Chlamydiales bacterium]|jgi:recombination protein RecR|nr:recombination protein RecR [Chlamydiales bacterium]